MNIALILAGGVGSRTKERIPKQFVLVNGKPVIIYTLEKFNKSEHIDQLYVVCLEGWKEKLREYAIEYNITKLVHICVGGNNGLKSAYNGLMCMQDLSDEDMVLIHDGVRPFVDEKIIEENLMTAYKFGLAMTAVDCVETLVHSSDGTYAEKIVSRDNLKRVQTPQTFSLGLLKQLFSDVDIDNCNQPSTFALYMSTGQSIVCSVGSEKNIKLTYPDDILRFYDWFK